MKTTPRRVLTATVAAFVALTLASCSAASGDSAEPVAATAGGTIVYATDVQPQAGGLDLFSSNAFANFNVLNQIYEPLIAKDDDGTVQPFLAESWEQVDETTWTFTLRDDVTFSSGTPMTASDVVFSLATLQAGLAGANFAGIATIEALDDLTVQVTTLGPDATVLNLLASRNNGIVSEEWYTNATEDERQTDAVGTGPFVLSNWEDNVSITLIKNEDYWGDDLPYADELVFDIIGDESARAAQLRQRSGTDLAWFRDPTQVSSLEAEGFIVGENASTRNLTMYINATEGPLADVNVRQAISLAMDREELINLAMSGYAEESYVVPAGDPDGIAPDEDAPFYTSDIDAAMDLLEEAGETSPTVKLTYASDAAFALDVPMVEVMKEQLAEAGITLELNPLPWAELLPAYIGGTWDDLILVPGTYQADPAFYFATILTPSLPMALSVTEESPAVALYQELRTTTDPDARAEVLLELEQMVAEDVNVLVAYTMPQRYEVWGDTVSGYVSDPYTTRVALKETFKTN